MLPKGSGPRKGLQNGDCYQYNQFTGAKAIRLAPQWETLVTYTFFFLIAINIWNWNKDLMIGTELKIEPHTVNIQVMLSIIEADTLLLFELMTKKTLKLIPQGNRRFLRQARMLPGNSVLPWPHFKAQTASKM